jgi:small subunit ribosomal protein S20
MRTSVKSGTRNKARRSSLWTYEKNLRKAIEEGNLEEAQQLLNKTFSLYDKATKTNVVHKNRANRKKARLSAALAKAKNG